MALSQLAILNAKPKDKPYLLLDGEGLHLQITRLAAGSGPLTSRSVGASPESTHVGYSCERSKVSEARNSHIINV